MADYSIKFEDKERVYSEEETARLALVRPLLDAFMKIITQNLFLIELADCANHATRSKRAKCVQELCSALIPGKDYSRNFSYTALTQLYKFMQKHLQPGFLLDYPELFTVFHDVRNSTATLFDRLRKLLPTTELQQAELAIGKVFAFLSAGDVCFCEGAPYNLVIHDAFNDFFRNCSENARLLQNEYLSGKAEIKAGVTQLIELSNNILNDTSGGQQGHPPKDRRCMKEKQHEMVVAAVFLVRNKGMSHAAAAKSIINEHLHDPIGTCYGMNQLESFRRAIGRELQKPTPFNARPTPR